MSIRGLIIIFSFPPVFLLYRLCYEFVAEIQERPKREAQEADD